jgi:hypothetical protein
VRENRQRNGRDETAVDFNQTCGLNECNAHTTVLIAKRLGYGASDGAVLDVRIFGIICPFFKAHTIGRSFSHREDAISQILAGDGTGIEPNSQASEIILRAYVKWLMIVLQKLEFWTMGFIVYGFQFNGRAVKVAGWIAVGNASDWHEVLTSSSLLPIDN